MRALQGDDLLVYGDGKQTRCFTYVSDAVEATIAAMDEKVNGEIINIGSEDEKKHSRSSARYSSIDAFIFQNCSCAI